jgi:hypothetical protein
VCHATFRNFTGALSIARKTFKEIEERVKLLQQQGLEENFAE